MKQYIIPQKINLQAFLGGQNPEIEMGAPQLHVKEIAQFQQCRQIQGEGRWVADMAFICERPDLALIGRVYAGVDPSSMTGVMIQVFNTHDKSSRLFTLDVKDGHIDWDALRNSIQSHIQTPKGVSDHWQNASGVDETQIHHASRFTEKIATEIMRPETDFSQQEKQNFIQSAINGYALSVAPNEYMRMIYAIGGAIDEISPVGDYLEMNIAQNNVVCNLHDPFQRACWEFSKISDVASLNMREQWTGHYAEFQQKYTPEQSAALATITVTANAIKRYEHYQGNKEAQRLSPGDFFTCQHLQESAICDARAAGCTKYEIGQAMNPEIQSAFKMLSSIEPTNAYIGWAARAYCVMLPEENRAAVVQLLQREAQKNDEPIPIDKFIKAVQTAESEISRMTGIPQAQLPTIATMQENINAMRQSTSEPSAYSTLHAGAFTPEQHRALQKKFIEFCVAESVSRRVDTEACAIAMYKASRALQQEPNWNGDPTLRYHLSEVRTHAMRDMELNGMSADDIYAALDGRDDMGDEDIGDDAI